jgi:hypothetical protein
MAANNRKRSEIKIDESSLVAETSIFSRFLNALYAVVLGIVLVQVYYFFTGAGSVVVLFDSLFFLGYLGVCAILGWIVGENFIAWLKDEIGNWKFW